MRKRVLLVLGAAVVGLIGRYCAGEIVVELVVYLMVAFLVAVFAIGFVTDRRDNVN